MYLLYFWILCQWFYPNNLGTNYNLQFFSLFLALSISLFGLSGYATRWNAIKRSINLNSRSRPRKLGSDHSKVQILHQHHEFWPEILICRRTQQGINYLPIHSNQIQNHAKTAVDSSKRDKIRLRNKPNSSIIQQPEKNNTSIQRQEHWSGETNQDHKKHQETRTWCTFSLGADPYIYTVEP